MFRQAWFRTSTCSEQLLLELAEGVVLPCLLCVSPHGEIRAINLHEVPGFIKRFVLLLENPAERLNVGPVRAVAVVLDEKLMPPWEAAAMKLSTGGAACLVLTSLSAA